MTPAIPDCCSAAKRLVLILLTQALWHCGSANLMVHAVSTYEHYHLPHCIAAAAKISRLTEYVNQKMAFSLGDLANTNAAICCLMLNRDSNIWFIDQA